MSEPIRPFQSEQELTDTVRALAKQWVTSGLCISEQHAYHMMMEWDKKLLRGACIVIDDDGTTHIVQRP